MWMCRPSQDTVVQCRENFQPSNPFTRGTKPNSPGHCFRNSLPVRMTHAKPCSPRLPTGIGRRPQSPMLRQWVWKFQTPFFMSLQCIPRPPTAQAHENPRCFTKFSPHKKSHMHPVDTDTHASGRAGSPALAKVHRVKYQATWNKLTPRTGLRSAAPRAG